MSFTEMDIIDHLDRWVGPYDDTDNITKLRRLARLDQPRDSHYHTNGVILLPQPMVSFYGDASGNLLDQSNHIAMIDSIRSVCPVPYDELVDSYLDPDGMRQAWIQLPAFDVALHEFVKLYIYVKEQFPALDEQDWSDREWEATEHFFTENWSYCLSDDGLAEEIQSLYDDGHKSIANDILEAAFTAGVESGLCDNFSWDNATDAAAGCALRWERLHRWLIETSGGNQTCLPF